MFVFLRLSLSFWLRRCNVSQFNKAKCAIVEWKMKTNVRYITLCIKKPTLNRCYLTWKDFFFFFCSRPFIGQLLLIWSQWRVWNQTANKSCLKVNNITESDVSSRFWYPCAFLKHKRTHVAICTRVVSACVRLSWAELCVKAHFNEAGATHILYYCRARRCSWPSSLSPLLRELLDSFSFVCVCVCTWSLCLCVAVDVPVWNCTEWVIFPWRGNDWSLECVINPIFTLSSHLSPAFDWSGWDRTLSQITKYNTPKEHRHRHTHTQTHYTLVWKGSSLFL